MVGIVAAVVKEVDRDVNKKQQTRNSQEECCGAVERRGETPARLAYHRNIPHQSIKMMAQK
jgi:hypothetical protein